MTAVEHIKRRIRVLEKALGLANRLKLSKVSLAYSVAIQELRGILWAIEQEGEDDHD